MSYALRFMLASLLTVPTASAAPDFLSCVNLLGSEDRPLVEQVTRYYLELLAQYRNEVADEEEFLRRIHAALKSERYFEFRPEGGQTAAVDTIRQIGEFQEIDRLALNRRIQQELQKLARGIDEVVEDAEQIALKSRKIEESLRVQRISGIQWGMPDERGAFFSKNGKDVIGVDQTGKLFRLDFDTGTRTILKGQGPTKAAVFVSPDGQRMIVHLGNKSYALLDRAGTEILARIEPDRQLNSATFSLYGVDWEKELLFGATSRYPGASAILDFRGKVVTSIQGFPALNCPRFRWDTKTGKTELVGLFPGDQGTQTLHYWSRNPDLQGSVLTGKEGATMTAYYADLENGRIAGGDRTGYVSFWRVESLRNGSKEPEMGIQAHQSQILKLSMTSDGTRMLTISYDDKSVHLWDVKSRAKIKVLRGHRRDYPNAVVLSPDGSLALSSSMTETILWRLSDGQVLRRFEGYALASVNEAFDRVMLSQLYRDEVLLIELDIPHLILRETEEAMSPHL